MVSFSEDLKKSCLDVWELAHEQHGVFQLICNVEEDYDEWLKLNDSAMQEQLVKCHDNSAMFRAYSQGIRVMRSFQTRAVNFGNTNGVKAVISMIEQYSIDQEFEESDHIVWNGSALLQDIDPTKHQLYKDEM